jgi:hypothetical protein
VPGPYNAGAIFLQVIPSFRGSEAAIAQEGRALARGLSDSFDEEFQKSISDGVKKGVEKGAKDSQDSSRKAGKTSGDAYAGAFQDSINKALAAANRQVPHIKIQADDKDLQRTLEQAKRDLAKLSGPKVNLDLDAGAMYRKLADVEAAFRKIQDEAGSIDARVNSAVAMATIEKLRADLMSLSAIQIEPDIKVDRKLGAFERSFKQAIQGAIEDIGTVEIDADVNTTAGQRKLADLRAQLLALSDKEIGVNISTFEALAELKRLRDQLDIMSMGRWGADVDVNTYEAKAKLDSVLSALREVDGSHARATVDVDGAAAAVVQLAALDHELDSANRASSNAANSFRAFNGVLFGITTIGPAIIPVLAGAAGALLAMGPLAVAGAAGLGTMVLGLSGVTTAVKALNAQQATSTTQQQTYARAVQTSAASVRDAEQGVASARESAARSAQSSAASVQAAEEGVASARESAARSAQSSAASVQAAEEGVASARESAARSAQSSEAAIASALKSVESAEADVADAQRARQRAQEDLTQAVKDAREEQENLSLSLRDSQLSEKEAALNLREAQKALAEGLAGGATGDDLAKLQLRVERYQLALDQAKEHTGDLQAQTDEFARTGVEGTDAVLSARERLASADRNLIAAQQRVADAQAQVAAARLSADQSAVDSAKAVASAQAQLADARLSADQSALDSAKAVASAQAQLADARLSADQSAADSAKAVRDAQERLTDAQTKYTESLDNVNSAQQKVTQSMAALSPAGRDFSNFLFGLQDNFKALRFVAQEGFLPGLQSWMQTITGTYGPQLQRTIFNLSSAIGDMFRDFGSALLTKPFQDLFDMIENDGPRFIGYMSDVLVYMGKGTASLVVAMAPLADFFGDLIVRGAKAFADWAAGLRGSSGLQSFFDYVERITPKIIDFFMALGGAVFNLAKALAPYGELLLGILTNVAEWIAKMDTEKLGAVAVGIISTIAAMQTVFGLTAGLKSVLEAWHGISLVTSVLGSTWTTLIGSVILLAGAIFILYQRSDTFRSIVDALWRDVLKPVAEFLASVLVPALDGLGGLLNDHIELVALVAAAWAGWKILTTVHGWIDLTISKVNGLKAAIGRAGLLGIIGGVAIGGGFALDQNQQETNRIQGNVDSLFNQLRGGGDAAANAQRLLSAMKSNNDNFADTLNGIFGTSNSEIFEKAHQAYVQQWNDMTNLEQAQSKVAEWTKTLADRQNSGTATAHELSAAHERLDYWTGQVEIEQRQLNDAATGLNTTLLEQQGIAIALAQADIAYQQSVNQLDDAHQRYVDTLNDVNATEQERSAAEETYINQALATAQAAGQVAAARHANADAATREAYTNAALLIDLERQKEQYGELPPRLEQLRASLAATIDPAIIAATKMEELGIKVANIPDTKTMVFNTEPTQEQIALLETLGFKIEHLPDGTVRAVAETQAAEDALAQVARDRTSTITSGVTFYDGTNWEAVRDSINRYGAGALDPRGGRIARARGGPVWGAGSATSDSIPAWLSNGEFVVRAKAVSKYGLGLLHDLNSMRLAEGGLVQGYAGGGLVADWGGTIDLQGGNLSPLAGQWALAIMQINSLSQIAANSVAASFAAMRDGVISALAGVQEAAARILGQQFGAMIATTVAANSALYAEQIRYSAQLLGLTTSTSTALQGMNIQYYGALLNLTLTMDATLYGEQLRQATQRMALTSATNTALQGMYIQFYGALLSLTVTMDNAMYGEELRFASQWMGLVTATTNAVQGIYIRFSGSLLQLFQTLDSTLLGVWIGFSTTFINLTTGMVNIVGAQFDRLRALTALPVNFVIVSVLNGGLFPALNSISSTFGLNQNVPNAAPIAKLAMGGRVWGNSPTKTADNIPAWLTAGEYVHPVDTVDYYGADFMELLRRRAIPREMLPGFATGGQATWTQLDALRARLFPGSVLTSGYRPGANDYHGMGMAIDIGVPGNVVAKLIPIAQALAHLYPQSAEIINNPGASVKNGQPVPSSFWGAATWAAHANHVHWAMTMAQLLLGANPAGFVPGLASVDPSSVLDQLNNSISGPVAKLFEQFGHSPFVNMLGAVPAKLVAGIWGKIQSRVVEALSLTLGDGSLAGAQTTGPVQDIVRSVAKQFGWDSGAEWNALSWIIQHESGWNPNAQNPTSTAYGLFQFLNGTWASTGIAKTADPAQQSLAGMRYIKGRYVDPIGAQRFWQANGWYSGGGEVGPNGPITPELMDTGGWIHPGLNVIMNKTGRSEPVINPQTLDALVSIGERGAESALIGSLTVPVMNGPSANEVAGEIFHHATVARRGGRYS